MSGHYVASTSYTHRSLNPTRYPHHPGRRLSQEESKFPTGRRMMQESVASRRYMRSFAACCDHLSHACWRKTCSLAESLRPLDAERMSGIERNVVKQLTGVLPLPFKYVSKSDTCAGHFIALPALPFGLRLVPDGYIDVRFGVCALPERMV